MNTRQLARLTCTLVLGLTLMPSHARCQEPDAEQLDPETGATAALSSDAAAAALQDAATETATEPAPPADPGDAGPGGEGNAPLEPVVLQQPAGPRPDLRFTNQTGDNELRALYMRGAEEYQRVLGAIRESEQWLIDNRNIAGSLQRGRDELAAHQRYRDQLLAQGRRIYDRYYEVNAGPTIQASRPVGFNTWSHAAQVFWLTVLAPRPPAHGLADSRWH